MSGSILQHIPRFTDAFDYQDKIKVSHASYYAYRNNLRYFNDWLTKQGYNCDNLPTHVTHFALLEAPGTMILLQKGKAWLSVQSGSN